MFFKARFLQSELFVLFLWRVHMSHDKLWPSILGLFNFVLWSNWTRSLLDIVGQKSSSSTDWICDLLLSLAQCRCLVLSCNFHHLLITVRDALVSRASVWCFAERRNLSCCFKQRIMSPLAAVCAVLRTPGSGWHMPSPLAAVWQSTYHTGWGPPRGQSWGVAMGPSATIETWLALLLQLESF